MILDHIGSCSSRIDISIVNSGFRNYMFSQIIAAHAHKLHAVQGASAQIGSRSRMGCQSFKIKVGSHNCIAVHRIHLVGRRRMPCVYKIHIVKHPRTGHELFRSGPFLGRAAKIDNGAVFTELFQIFLNRYRSGQSAGSKGTMTAAMARRTFH